MNLIRPGLKFTADVITQPVVGLAPTMSTYGYGFELESCPQKNTVYVICEDGSVQSVEDPERPIGWELLEDDNGFAFRVTQMNHGPKPCLVYARGYITDPPIGRGKIGSIVYVCRVSTPEPTPATTPVCPGAPMKNYRVGP